MTLLGSLTKHIGRVAYWNVGEPLPQKPHRNSLLRRDGGFPIAAKMEPPPLVFPASVQLGQSCLQRVL